MSKAKKKEPCKNCESDLYEWIDIFGVGQLTDQHYEIEATEEELARRLADANELNKRLGGNPNSLGIDEEIGRLIKPKLTWEDFVQFQLAQRQEESGRNNWSVPRIRPLFAGLYLPKKKKIIAKLLVLVDRSGSVSNEDATYGVSQIQVFGDRCEGWVLCFDTKPYYEAVTKIRNANLETLQQVKFKGGGATQLSSSFLTYEEELGKVDLVIVITDGMIFDLENLKQMGNPKNTQVVWLITSQVEFKQPFGRSFQLRND